MTKGQINRLGESIREKLNKGEEISKGELDQLQEFRVSYKNALKIANLEINKILKRLEKNAVVVYRIKRIESIKSKLLRQPKMNLSRMEDIAGLRCIVKDEQAVYKVKDALEQYSNLNPKLLHDYIQKPRVSGYKSLHFSISADSKILELQIRSDTQHDWATLVEITDEILGTHLKERNDDNGTGMHRFFQLLSDYKKLTAVEYNEIFHILRRNSYIKKLTKTFEKNSNPVRKIWYSLGDIDNAMFYLFEITEDKLPEIKNFKNFDDAEDAYINDFENKSRFNIVMAYIPNNDIDLVSKVYSNYMLLEHNFYKILSEMAYRNLQIENNIIRAYYFICFCNYIKYHFQFLELLSAYENRDSNTSNKKWLKEIQRTYEKEHKKLYSKENALQIKKNQFIVKIMLVLINKYFRIKLNREVLLIKKQLQQ